MGKIEKIEKIFAPKKDKLVETKKTKNRLKKKRETLIFEDDLAISESGKTKNKNLKKILLIALAFVLVGGLTGTSFYFYRQYKATAVKSAPVEILKDEASVIIEEIRSFMELPDEVPTLATVTDIEQAKSQAFFSKAQNGDKVLIYVKSAKAILYRPSTKKIIEVANVSGIDNKEITSESIINQKENEIFKNPEEVKNDNQESVQRITKIAVYNGSKVKGLAATLADKISDIENTEIVEKTNSKNSYENNLIIDISGNNSEIIEKIISEIGGETGDFPENELKPDADILIIGGRN